MKQEKSIKGIPFGNGVRIGNYRIWRTTVGFGAKTNKAAVQCIYVSILDGSWQIRIPATFEMFALIASLYGDFISDDEKKRESASAKMQTIFGNMMFVSVVANGYFQQAVQSCAVAYANPGILEEHFFDDMKKLASDFLKWRKQYDAMKETHEPTPEEEHQEDLANEAIEILSKE